MGTDSQKREATCQVVRSRSAMIRFRGRGDGANQIVGRRSYGDTIFR